MERIHQSVDWVRIGKLAAQVYDAPEGRHSYPPLLMVKVLLLEQWHNLSDPQMSDPQMEDPQMSDPQMSDPQMEEALGDRISL